MIKRWLAWALVGAAASLPARADQAADIQGLWSDREFKKAFLGTYGVHPDVEPRVGPEDRLVLEKVYPLLSSDPAGAALMIGEANKPESSAIFDFVLGNLDFQGDRMAEAEVHYRRAVTKFPAFRRAWRNLGLIQARDRRFDEAIASFTRMIELGGGDAISFGLLGSAYFAKLDYLATEAAFRQALLLEPTNAQWRVGLARCVVKQEKYEEAASLLGVLIERDPERSEFWMLQANAYLGMKQPLKAAENLEMVSLMGKGTPDLMSLLGDIYLDQGLLDLSAGAYIRGIDLDASQPAAKPLRAADILAGRGALAQAKNVARRIRSQLAAVLSEEETLNLSKLEARIAVAEGEGGEAVRILEEVVTRDPLDGAALMLIGQHYASAGDPERAIIYYERAAGIDRYEAPAKLRHAQVLVGQSRYEDAVPLLKRVQEIKPREQVSLLLAQVERLARAAR